jgi:hypothetical protein
LLHHYEAISLGTAKISDSIDLENSRRVERIGRAMRAIKKDEEFKVLTTGGGQNSSGLYRNKINFVADRLRKVS